VFDPFLIPAADPAGFLGHNPRSVAYVFAICSPRKADPAVNRETIGPFTILYENVSARFNIRRTRRGGTLPTAEYSRVPFAVADAEAMKDVLVQQMKVPVQNITLLDGSGSDAEPSGERSPVRDQPAWS
jgi:hypothetical protein